MLLLVSELFETDDYNWIQMFLLWIFEAVKNDTAFSMIRSCLTDTWIFKFFLTWLALEGGSQFLFVSPVTQVTGTLFF